MMLASFQFSGMIPSERERLNNLHIEGPISSAILRRSLLGMLSGPHALFGSKLRSTSATSSGVNCMLERQLVLALDEAVKLVGGSRSVREKQSERSDKNVCLLHTALYEFSAIAEKSRLLVYFC